MQITDIARVCHEANRALQAIQRDPVPSPGWEAAPQSQRDAAEAGVKDALSGATPEQLHESWCAHKQAAGWVYGETKDEGAKTHPCLVPYDKLDQGQRDKDAVFTAIVQALA